ncbi:TrbI/VirB10 family protein [Frateuria terrea]|uniref:Type IV secretion system protein VirB10 n=1 Tax=Frateuria terrea TaxID=529704 RepID=A0A1H6U5Y1_9GAMM|nr:TrbI/VirB10 family protein [Frateuria terrea]SEI83735.1 type IV secretion system protein VirB10 [Frateuria terrea]SFP40153.1 type IV secretion system protein VirB10 [Frateuria terrea]
MSTQTPYPAAADDADAGHGEALAHNPYSTHYRQAAVPELDGHAPVLKSNELRRMNRRALIMLGVAAAMLLFVSYWMISGATSRKQPHKPREEKVTVAEAPPPLFMPPARTREAQSIPLAPRNPIPTLPLPQAASQPLRDSQGYARNEPSLVERRIAGASDPATDLPSSPPPAAAPQGAGASLSGHAAMAKAKPLEQADTLMQRGTYIRCVLETRIVTDVPGYASCLVTEPVYSFNGRKLLLPKGSKVLGAYSNGPKGRRVAVVWDRIITPAGIDVDMSSKPSPGIDNLGGAGLPGHYDAHWRSRISAALLVSMLSDAFKYEAAEHGPKTSAIAANGVVVQEPFESNTARTVQNLADMAVREAANRPPTITINQGTVIYVYVARDVDFSDVVARS